MYLIYSFPKSAWSVEGLVNIFVIIVSPKQNRLLPYARGVAIQVGTALDIHIANIKPL